jgi:uncharacterized protein YpbB
VLRDYGNISSGSFLVSLERLLAEGCVSAGDRGVMVTMGPGAQIETALLEFCTPGAVVQNSVKALRAMTPESALPLLSGIKVTRSSQ